MALFSILAAFSVASCGDAGSTGTASDCLTPEEVERQVDQIAAGIEGSQAEVDQKQDDIRQVRASQCD